MDCVERVWIAGHKPSWVVGVEYLPTTQKLSRYENSRRNLLAACEASDVSEEFVLMHDDLFILLPTVTIPVRHRGTVDEVLGSARLASVYQRGLVACAVLLRSWGVADPLDYELHIPIVLSKERMLEAIQRTPEGGPLVAAAVKTLYGNLWEIGGERMDDVKIRSGRDGIPEGARFVSSMGTSFKSGQLGRDLRERFPEPGPYEV